MQKQLQGFTLIELLVVMAVIVLLSALAAPGIMKSLESSRRANCAGNLRQLALANYAYAMDHGTFVAAAEDIWSGNKKRWHGTRKSSSEPFDPRTSPLVEYLGADGRVKECPSFHPDAYGFETGCGGYGYNTQGVGSQAYIYGAYKGSEKGMPPGMIDNPIKTVMFADAAFLARQRNGEQVIEYSFAEAYFHISDMQPVEGYKAVPSIHFRHGGYANVVWVDGHVSAETLTTEYGSIYTRAGFGWFGPADNSLFDPN